jgi:D-alanyl-D-alanine-carboxypeptidase/D-alanyl-D-alanine-endopeptidase
MSRGIVVICVLVVLWCGTLLFAKRRDARGDRNLAPSFTRRLEQLVAPYVDPSGSRGKAIGLVVGVSSPRGRTVIGLGATTRHGATQPGADTLFEIGSVAKVFTGYLLARALDRGEVGLGDLIDPFFPQGAPQYQGHSITLLDLATHTSGLRAPKPDPEHPHLAYTAQELAVFMASYTLRVQPGTEYHYSNIGAGTLGYILFTRSGLSSYASLVRRDITDPLGLIDTRIHLSEEQEARLAQGYFPDGRPFSRHDIGTVLGAGGAMRSTARDLLGFLDSALGKGPQEAVSAWQRVLVPRRPSPHGRNGHTGLLINIQDYGQHLMYGKGGRTPGFTSQIMFTIKPAVTVVALANGHPQKLRDLTRLILDELLSMQ